MTGDAVERVVVLRALGLGDLLTGVPALQALRSAYPAAWILLAGPAALAPLAHASGAVDEVVDVRGLDAPLPAALRGADVAVNLHGRGPQSHRLLLDSAPATSAQRSAGHCRARNAAPGWITVQPRSRGGTP
ncbi:MAG TPA: hypothetical protein VEZ46_04525 [Mycobacteriales bacterium]|nr:hypothetical protein [Mycobacteriales bacterium]